MVTDDELRHYGVVGMKWGVRKAERLHANNRKLAIKESKYNKKAAVYRKRSEKIHADKDLGAANKQAIKAANYSKKAAKLEKRAVTSESDYDRTRFIKKAAKFDYKAAKATQKSNRISKTTGYGVDAMKWSIKSDKFAAKAAKANMKIANNDAYIATTKRKISSLSDAELASGKEYVDRLRALKPL